MKRERLLALLILLSLLAVLLFVGRRIGWVRSGPVVVSTVLLRKG